MLSLQVTTKHYLVKWRSLPYEDCTWELEADVDPKKIEDFLRWRNPPAEEDWAGIERPNKKEWVEYKESPAFKNGNTLRPSLGGEIHPQRRTGPA